MKITAIYGSPRKNGNTDLLMKAFLKGVSKGGGTAHEIFLRDLHFSACIECGGCNNTGKCVLKDDMDSIYPHLKSSEIIVLSAPVFFYGLNALAKAMVDRSQCFWTAKYLLNNNLSAERGSKGKGILLSAGGSKGKKTFDSMLLTVRYFFDVIDMEFSHHLLYRNIDAIGAISKHPTVLEDAYQLGKTVME